MAKKNTEPKPKAKINNNPEGKGGFSIGNEIWKLAENVGRPRKIKSVKDFATRAIAYFKWCEENPLKENVVIPKPWTEIVKKRKRSAADPKKWITTREEVKHSHSTTTIDKKRPYTLMGLCLFMEIDVNTFYNYMASSDYFQIATYVKSTIEDQQYTGAATGFFKENIVARMIGLADKKDVTTGGESLNQVTIFQLPDNSRTNALIDVTPIADMLPQNNRDDAPNKEFTPFEED